MDIRRCSCICGVLLLAIGLGACASQPGSQRGDQPASERVGGGSSVSEAVPTVRSGDEVEAPQTLDEVLAALRASGADVSEEGQVTQPFLSQPGTATNVNGEQVQLFAYPDEETARAEAGTLANVLAGRSTVMVSWVAPPHGYHAGRLVALYLGSNAETLQLLEGALGPELGTF